jgi:hypothetical protein
MAIKINFSRWLRSATLLSGLLLIALPALGQTVDKPQVAKTTVTANNARNTTPVQPTFGDYRGITIGMSTDAVRSKLSHLQDKGKTQDFFVLSDTETAQVFYDQDGKVIAISIDYAGKGSNPPTAREVLGEDIPAKPNGSMYNLKRYPSAGYWVSYNRTAGDSPTVTITMQQSQP